MVQVIQAPELGKIVVGVGALSELKSEVEKLAPHKIAVVTTRKVADLWLEELLGRLGKGALTIVLEEGEAAKELKVAEKLWSTLLDWNFTRTSLLVGLGGGALCDVVGFVASTYMRGTLLALLPTTLLAQVDAAVGGKTGVNLRGKNVIGTFYPAHLTLIDPLVLRTLPESEIANGLAEVVKYGVVADPQLFKLLEEQGEALLKANDSLMGEVVARCVRIKADIVAKDPRESGPRMVLNFGHTVGHAIEACSNMALKHGQAVSVGMVCSCEIAERVLAFKEKGRVVELLTRLGLPTELKYSPEEVLRYVRMDKKAWYGRTVFVLPTEIGSAVIREVGDDVLLEVLGDLA